MTSGQVEFDVSDGDWRITGTYASRDNIVIYHKGEQYRTATYPGYKIWNIPAHIQEHIADLEAELSRDVARNRQTVSPRAADLPDGTVVATETRAWMKNRHGEWRSTAGGNDGRLFRDGLPAGARVLRHGYDGSSDE